MRPTKAMAAKIGQCCVDELQKRERPDDVSEINVAILLWDAKRTELFVRSGTAALDRALRKAIDAEGR